MIIAERVKKIKGLSKNFRKKKFLQEIVVFFCYKMAFLKYIIRYEEKAKKASFENAREGHKEYLGD